MKKIFTLAIAVLASFSMWADITWTAPQEATQIDYYQTMDDGASLFASKTKTGSNVTPEEKEGRWSIKSTNSGGFWLIPASDITKITVPYLCSSTNSANIKYKIQSTKFGTDLNSAAEVEFEVKNNAGKNVWHEAEMSIEVKKDECIYVKFPTNVYISQVILSAAPKCTAPEKELVLKADKETIYVGDEVTFTTEGGNGNPVTIVGANGNVITDKWTAVEGKHKFLASQEAAGDVCAQESFLELTVMTKNPVTAVTIDGPKEAYVGAELVYTATAANATQFAWSVDGKDANTNAAEFKYTAVEGEHSIVCKARNDFNATDEWIASAELKLVVTAICGELIKAELKGGNSANVTGIIGGTFDSNLSNGKYKLDKNVYIGVVLKDGATFAEGDIFNINTSAAAGQGTMAIYGDKAGTDLVYQAEEGNWGVAGNNEIELPAAANGKTALYLYRPDDAAAWNPTVAYISVTRECSKEPKLSVSPASVKLTVTDAQAQPNEKVVFSGKYLTPGTYDLDMQPIAGLSVSPTSVTVDADGKLNAEVILTYENEADAEVATALLTLTIGEKSAQVQVTCSAKHGKQYMKSVNIEQWILDNGKNNAAFNDVLDNANIEYLNINGLDSLDDSKGAGRNEPYLGLKLKKKGAKIAGYLKKGEDALKVKFGHVSDSLTLGINGEYRTLRKEEAAEILSLGINPVIDRYVEIITTTDATVVIKQIMVNEEIADVVLPEGATAIENTEAATKATKVIRDGQLYILHNGKMYNVQGAVVK